MKIGDVIQNARQVKGISQRELAARIGTNQPQVVRWERAESLTLESLRRIAAGLAIAVEDLLTATPNDPNATRCALCGAEGVHLYNLGRRLHQNVFCLACILAEPEDCLAIRDGYRTVGP